MSDRSIRSTFKDNSGSCSNKTSFCLPTCSYRGVNFNLFGLCKLHGYLCKSVEKKPSYIRRVNNKENSNILYEDRRNNSLKRLFEKKNLTLFNLLIYGCLCKCYTSDLLKVRSQSIESEGSTISKFNHQLILISPIVNFMAS